MMRRAPTLALAALMGCATLPEPPPAAPKAESPKPEAQKPPPDPEAWRAGRPKTGDPPALKIPVFQKATLKNGFSVYVSEQPALPIVSLAVAFRAGSGADAKGKGGLADLTYGVFLEGAGKRDAIKLAEAFGDLGVSPMKRTDLDGALVSVTVLARNAGAALSLLSDVAQRPRFAKEDFERRKKLQLADLAAQLGNPRFLSRWAVVDAVFGPGHPYGHPAVGVPATIDAISLGDVKKFYKQNVGPAAAALVVTGQASLPEATAWAEKHFGAWKASAKAPPEAPNPAVESRKEVVFVPKAGLSQTVIAVARAGIPSGHPDLEGLLIADGVLGGNFSSRLNMNLREGKGYTYGAFSAVQVNRGAGSIFAGAAVRADATGPSLTEVFAEIKALKSKPIAAGEMDNSRENLVRSMPGWFETAEALNGVAAGLFWRDLPLDRYEKILAALKAADLPRVQALAEKYYDAAVMKVVLVGDAEAVEKQVPALGLGDLVRRPPPEMPVSPKKR